jgi:hypothetical protein|tara:strand:+ start:162 stop:623 length:462 start_codon:yes stop_codon:yes gene_type:complete
VIATLDPIEARFLAKVAEPDGNGCHLWTASTDKDGYGQFQLAGRKVKAHRYAAGMLDFPPEIQTRHICHVPACVNPEHLTFGSHADNMADRGAAGRQAKGVSQGLAKLTEENVIEIRRRYAEGGVTQRKLADEFGVSRRSVYRVVLRKTWAHV